MPDLTLEQKALELQRKMEDAEKKAEEAVKEAKAAKAAAEEATSKLTKKAEEALEERKKEGENLDKTVKAQQKAIEDLSKKLKEKNGKSFDIVLREFMEENKDAMVKFIESKTYGTASFKFATSNITNSSLGVQLDQNIYAERLAANAFLSTFPHITRTGNSIEWLEGSDTDNTGYVGELEEPKTGNSYELAGKTRRFAKVATFIEVSQEIEDWFNAVYQWARTRGIARVLRKADNLIWNGDGADTTKPNHVYGLKTSGSTAYAATGAKYENANIADVILDAIAQAKANGFSPNVAIVPTAIEAQIRGLKDKNGNYLFNQITGMLGQVKIVLTDQLSATEIVVADTSCVAIIDKGEYEMELERLAGKDGWRVWLRKSFQIQVPTSEKKGVIYVANTTTAIAALAPAA
jgi:HK97 family phage major capsid protein|nr:MAG TPA_asm: major capsid protein [Caudoviricetes sp.]